MDDLRARLVAPGRNDKIKIFHKENEFVLVIGNRDNIFDFIGIGVFTL